MGVAVSVVWGGMVVIAVGMGDIEVVEEGVIVALGG